MNNLILTTKGSNGGYKISKVIEGLICIGLCVLLFWFVMNKKISDSDPFFLPFMILAGSSATCGVITCMVPPLIFGQSYLDFYPNNICGKGIQGISVVDFNFDIHQVTSITTNKCFVYITTPAGKYKIVASVKKAQEVLYYYSNLNTFPAGRSAVLPRDDKTMFCPQCGNNITGKFCTRCGHRIN